MVNWTIKYIINVIISQQADKKNLTTGNKIIKKKKVYTKNDKKIDLMTKKIINNNITNPNFYPDLRNQPNTGIFQRK